MILKEPKPGFRQHYENLGNNMYHFIRSVVKFLLPAKLYRVATRPFHYIVALVGAVYYRFPSRKLTVIGVTGTNGKSTVVEMLHAVILAAGMSVASVSSIRTKINEKEKRNTRKMTMGGRMFVHKFLREAVDKGVKIAVVEVTSEGILQYRHKGIHFDIAVLTNITPEHIEAHGSYENYQRTKRKLFKAASIHILNRDSGGYELLRALSGKDRVTYGKDDIQRENITLQLPGDFNKMNALATLQTARVLGIDDDVTKGALGKITTIRGRFQKIHDHPNIIVDYAHTPDALENVYRAARNETKGKLICVLGSTGGGRDKWKRPKHGEIATSMCDEVIFTNEDPYDEDPQQIISDMTKTLTTKNHTIELDRRAAIAKALKAAASDDTIIITGKGSESVMAVAGEQTIPWDDVVVVRELLEIDQE